MASTNAYYAVVRIPGDGGETDDASFTGTTPLASGNSASFKLKGGKYGVTFLCSTFTAATLQVLAQDGSTWITAQTLSSASAYVTIDLLPGDYRIALA